MDQGAARWRQLLLLAAVQLFGMSVWLAGSAVAPLLSVSLSLSPSQAGWLTSGVQLGFVAGTLVAAVLNLADLWPARVYVAISATIAAVANAAILLAPDFETAALSRFFTGVALAGVYPPAMKMAATWFRSGRGLAIGTVVGALTAGKAVPYLLEGSGQLSLSGAILIPSGAALMAGVLVALMYHDGPYAFPTRPFSWRMVADVIRVPELRRIMLAANARKS